ncbi:MAG: type II secretion system protein [Candidatus Omnitrophica bacterium]|nr:type II secretion system protein [Candidatus Omnitrophota bacterium]
MKRFIKILCFGDCGFSYVETMVTMIIFGLLCSALYTSAAVGDQSWQANKTKIELQQEIRKSIERMRYELRETGNAAIFDVPADGNTYDQITFKVPTGVVGGAIVWSNDATEISLGGTDGEQLLMITPTKTTVVANYISGLQFRRQASSPHLLEITINASKDTTNGRTVTAQLNQKIQLRN